MTSPRADSDRLIAFPSSNLRPIAFVFRTRSLPPRSTIHILFVILRLVLASKQVINMRVMLQGANTRDTNLEPQKIFLPIVTSQTLVAQCSKLKDSLCFKIMLWFPSFSLRSCRAKFALTRRKNAFLTIVIRSGSYQCDLLEDWLEFVEAVDLERRPIVYSFFAWLKSLTWMVARLLISISPSESVWIERLHINNFGRPNHCVNSIKGENIAIQLWLFMMEYEF